MSNEILKSSTDLRWVVPSHPSPFSAMPAAQGPKKWLTWVFGLTLPRPAFHFLHLSGHLKLLSLVAYRCMHQAGYNDTYTTHINAHVMSSVITV